jgi:hypothetical protein
MATLKEQLVGWKPKRKVLLRGKKVSVKSALIQLKEENIKLRKNQCKPNAGCLSKYENYMEKFVHELNFTAKDVIEDN